MRLRHLTRRERMLKRAELLLTDILALLLIATALWVLKGHFVIPRRQIDISDTTVFALRIPPQTMPLLQAVAAEHEMDFAEILTFYLLEHQFFPILPEPAEKAPLVENFLNQYSQIKRAYLRRDVKPYLSLFSNILSELEYFPIPENYRASITYVDNWGMKMGISIYDRLNQKGRIPVISMTAGVVRDIGWADEIGYFIGIVTENGTYYRYAHLDSFDRNLVRDSEVLAGQQIGYMGNTGFGFMRRVLHNNPVQLEVAIKPDSLFKSQVWINPYAFLRLLEASNYATF